MTDPYEEDKDTKGQHSDQDVKQYKDEDVGTTQWWKLHLGVW